MKTVKIDIHDQEITQRGIWAIHDFYHTLAIHEQKYAQAIAFVTGIDSPFLNVMFDNRLDRTDSKALIEEVSHFFNIHQVPWSWFIFPACKQNDLQQQGLTLIEDAPAMYYNLLNPLPTVDSAWITIQEVDEKDDLKVWIQSVNEGFDSGDDDTYRQLNATLLHKGEKKLRHFVAYYKKTVAASGTLFFTKEAVMIHNLATRPLFQKLGLGRALSLHMMNIAKEMGYEHCYLDSSEEAIHFYKKLGFRVYATTLIYSVG